MDKVNFKQEILFMMNLRLTLLRDILNKKSAY